MVEHQFYTPATVNDSATYAQTDTLLTQLCSRPVHPSQGEAA